MEIGIRGEVALMIGGSRGIERGIAEAFAKEGCRVAIASINPASVEKTAGELTAEGHDVIGIAADCVTKDGIEHVVAEVTRQIGALDIVKFNVELVPKDPFMEIDDTMFAAASNNDIMAFLWVSRAIIPHMRAQGWRRILTVGTNSVNSRTAHCRVPGRTPTAWERWRSATACPPRLASSSSPSTSWAPARSRRSSCQVFWASNASGGLDFEHWREKVSAEIPMRRIGQPQDMGNAAVFLCSDAAGFITDQVLLIDGGHIGSLQ